MNASLSSSSINAGKAWRGQRCGASAVGASSAGDSSAILKAIRVNIGYYPFIGASPSVISMHDIFLSYSTKDRERLQPLFQALERQGWSVFWDHRTIDIGDHWSKKINHAIRTSKCVVVVWSKASVDSEWVVEEANIGKQRKVLLPIQIDAVDIPVGFTMRQTGDFVSWSGDTNDLQFTRLAEKVRELVGQHDAEQAQREAEAVAEQERLAKEKAAIEQQVREQAEQQRRLEEEARLRREAAEADHVQVAFASRCFDRIHRRDRRLHVVFKVQVTVLTVGVDPRNHEDGVALCYRPFDERILFTQVEDVILVDPRRYD